MRRQQQQQQQQQEQQRQQQQLLKQALEWGQNRMHNHVMLTHDI